MDSRRPLEARTEVTSPQREASEGRRSPDAPSSPGSGSYATAATMKSLLRSRPVQSLLPRLLGSYLWLILRTNRWTLDGAEHFAPHGAGASAVFSFWHEHLPLMPALAMLARRSPSYYPDPDPHAGQPAPRRTVYRRGGAPVRASNRSLVHRLAEAPPGCANCEPAAGRGDHRNDAGRSARTAAGGGTGRGTTGGAGGRADLPCAARTSRRIILKTWDRMPFPLPFGRGVVVCGPPIRCRAMLGATRCRRSPRR